MTEIFYKKIKKIIPEKWHFIFEHDGFKKYFKNTGWMFFAQMFNVVSVLVNVWVARYLGPQNFGLISYSLAFTGMFSFVANLGISGILIRDLIRYPEKRDKLLGTAFVLTLCGGIFAFILTTAFSFALIESPMVRNLAIVFALTFILSSFSVIANFFQANVLAKKNAQAQVIATVACAMLKAAVIFMGKGVIWLMLIYVCEYLIYALLYSLNYLRSGLSFKGWKFDRTVAREMLSVSWLLMLSSAAAYIYMKVDQVMVGYYMGAAAVGFYAAAVRLVEIWYFIPGIICSSLFPAVINAKRNNEALYRLRLINLYLLLGGLAVLIAFPSTLFASWVIKVFFGSAYSASVSIFRIYIW